MMIERSNTELDLRNVPAVARRQESRCHVAEASDRRRHDIAASKVEVTTMAWSMVGLKPEPGIAGVGDTATQQRVLACDYRRAENIASTDVLAAPAVEQ